MIVVDSSVWIDFFNGMPTPEVCELERLFHRRLLLVGDIVLCEVLAGARNEGKLAEIEDTFDNFVIVSMLGASLARAAAAHLAFSTSLCECLCIREGRNAA